MNYKLSIIATFFNKENSMENYLNSLLSFDKKDVQIIWVDDGSKDNTLAIIKEHIKNFKDTLPLVISQENKGPGGARNAGFNHVKGEFVWFTDGDDLVHNNDILSEVRGLDKTYDFIDFNYLYKGKEENTMSFEEGNHLISSDDDKVKIYSTFGRLWTKIFRTEFLKMNDIRYPENCVYEDNMLLFYLPLYVRKFKKTTKVGYEYAVGIGDSLTMNFSMKFYDRLFTSKEGYEKGVNLCVNNDSLKNILENKFKVLFYDNTVAISKRDIAFLNFKKIVLSIHVHRWYLELCKEYNITPELKPWLTLLNFFLDKKKSSKLIFKEIRNNEWNNIKM